MLVRDKYVMAGKHWQAPEPMRVSPCNRCGGQANLLSLPAYVLDEKIRECALVFIQCEGCKHRISSDELVGTDPGVDEEYKVSVLLGVWNGQAYHQLNAGFALQQTQKGAVSCPGLAPW